MIYLSRLKEIIFPICFVLMGIGMGLTSVNYEIGSISNPNAGFFPLVIGLGLICVGLLELRYYLKGIPGENDKDIEINKVSLIKILGVIILLFLWPALLPLLGYALVTLIVTLGIAKVFSVEGLSKPIILAIGTTLAVHYLFKVWFYLDLPEGVLFEWLKVVVLGG